jgi:hypothetical protein
LPNVAKADGDFPQERTRSGSAKGSRDLLDESLRGFGLMITNSGHKSWVIQYRSGGKSNRITLRERFFSLEEARAKALEILSKVAKGEDPTAKTAKEPTLGEIAENYLRIEGKKTSIIRSVSSHSGAACSAEARQDANRQD